MSSKHSTPPSKLTQRRKQGRGQRNPEGVDLSGQDQNLKDRESGLWVPAGAHREYADDDEEEEEEQEEEVSTHGHPGEVRGREEERPVVA